ncbi:NAD(P)-dependent dehydrogenase (short-subunit alcohol dehydrogenase family) [Thioalkalivibrio sp. ALE21]|uniref:SDR family oxidoreductase n=1 Tax=Thioalkalivibrio sp. ALE21 TaxID=1158175 RepID=UPI000D8DE9F7|nr:SDR family oxidoreductase [Thioalkalivibrio sp. ALE21]PYG04260.1 NAD(P)-dependent dehydrogenase (short-subunit alcohol dehydrogenase family) [Thioalkalivibrio sp. ALE21]
MSEHTPRQSHSRVALVTGAARGIGLGIAERLVQDGWKVVLADIDGRECEQAAARMGPAARAMTLDVRDEEQVREAIRRTEEWHGGLDALANNAGISDPHSGPLEGLDLADWQRWLDTNLTGAFLLAKHALPLLRRRRGAIVNISSTRALQSEPDTEAYAASKGGLDAFTHALAISAGPEVRVNAIRPGWIDTRSPDQQQAEPLSAQDHAQHPAGRVGQPADIAALAAFLLGPDAGFVTGQIWTADGGMTRRMIYAD